MSASIGKAIKEVMETIPKGVYVLCSCHGEKRCGILTRWVQQCSTTPPLIVVAIPKGSGVEPLIRDSRTFSICQLADNDRLSQNRFTLPGRDDEPFLGLDIEAAATGAPILSRATSYMDCEVVGNLMIESDCRIYVGQVIEAGSPQAILTTARSGGTPHVKKN
jgi:flavin reductase (DIM6/NTAB) family NADH-FMN oxidoreductase RutF